MRVCSFLASLLLAYCLSGCLTLKEEHCKVDLDTKTISYIFHDIGSDGTEDGVAVDWEELKTGSHLI